MVVEMVVLRASCWVEHLVVVTVVVTVVLTVESMDVLKAASSSKTVM